MPKTRKNHRKQRKGRATRRKQRGGASSRYPGLLVTSRGSDPEDPPVLMSYKDYRNTTAI